MTFRKFDFKIPFGASTAFYEFEILKVKFTIKYYDVWRLFAIV